MLFAPYAADMTRRVAGLAPGAVLEAACGTAIVTRALRATRADLTRSPGQSPRACAARYGTGGCEGSMMALVAH